MGAKEMSMGHLNLVWGSLVVDVLFRLGLRQVVISPGSRSTPLTIAFARHGQIECIPVLDERSAGFFALGLAKQKNRAVALVCTSGTAAANFYPAVIEAREGETPLILLTADRPPELRGCNAGQAIDQQKLYGAFPNFYSEVSLPLESQSQFRYLRQLIVTAWNRAHHPSCGVVHLNFPFREPLCEKLDESAESECKEILNGLLESVEEPVPCVRNLAGEKLNALMESFLGYGKGLIIVGVCNPGDPARFARAVGELAYQLGWPTLSDALNPLRNYASLNPCLVNSYDVILRNENIARALRPEAIISLGPLPTSKVLRAWLQSCDPRTWIFHEGEANLDGVHRNSTHIPIGVEVIAESFANKEEKVQAGSNNKAYAEQWRVLEIEAYGKVQNEMQAVHDNCEGRIAWELSKHLPHATPLFVASSMPVRDMEYFWTKGERKIVCYANRGAAGIDGTLSTALGIAHGNRSAVLLTGDLALLHDTNGFLVVPELRGHLTIVLINNNGGGIFESLLVAEMEPPFESFFATPQRADFEKIAGSYGVAYECIETNRQLVDRISHLPDSGVRILEVKTDRKREMAWRKKIFETIAAELRDSYSL